MARRRAAQPQATGTAGGAGRGRPAAPGDRRPRLSSFPPLVVAGIAFAGAASHHAVRLGGEERATVGSCLVAAPQQGGGAKVHDEGRRRSPPPALPAGGHTSQVWLAIPLADRRARDRRRWHAQLSVAGRQPVASGTVGGGSVSPCHSAASLARRPPGLGGWAPGWCCCWVRTVGFVLHGAHAAETQWISRKRALWWARASLQQTLPGRLCDALEVAWQWNHEGGGVLPVLAQLFVLGLQPGIKLGVDE